MKKVLSTQKSDYPHWVGDGFPVRTAFSYNDDVQMLSPFLLLDYAGPTEFEPTTHRRGVGAHPHRGFETVTIVYDGQVEHRDSSGGGGVIEKGDVQWMTAASGLVHDEFHGRDFAKKGGRFEMVQLWVNLPKEHKMTKPRYQGILSKEIQEVPFSAEQGSVRVIAGNYQGTAGPAKTFSPVNLWDIRLKAGATVDLSVPQGHTAMVLVLDGPVKVSGSHTLENAEIAFLDRENETVRLSAEKESKVLFLGGAPLNEPVFGMGPFVMNTSNEIVQAMRDYEAGKMGSLDPIEGSNS